MDPLCRRKVVEPDKAEVFSPELARVWTDSGLFCDTFSATMGLKEAILQSGLETGQLTPSPVISLVSMISGIKDWVRLG